MKNKNPSLQQVAFIRPKMVKKSLKRIKNQKKKNGAKIQTFDLLFS